MPPEASASAGAVPGDNAFKRQLAEALARADSVIIAGLGNVLNGDDGFGVFVTDALGDFGKARSISVHTVPENFSKKIADARPDLVIFVDTAWLETRPGDMQILSPDDLARILTITHRVPLSKVIERLWSFHKCDVMIIGMQPGSMEIGEPMSEEARKAADALLTIFRTFLAKDSPRPPDI